MSQQGFSIRIFVPSGEPEALRIVEKVNWTGQGLVFPRSRFDEARQRKELASTGVYVLWGPGETDQLPLVYVGEGDAVLPRLEQHVRNKDFWTHAAVFTSKDQNLNKAHGQYLEARLVELASAAKRCELDNGNIPQRPALSEADEADAERYLDDLLLCLPVVGVGFFERPGHDLRRNATLALKSRDIDAKGYDGPDGFVVLAGSRATKKETPSIHPYQAALRSTLLRNGVLEDIGDVYSFSQDYTFGSPSTASSVLLGRRSNGRVEWKDSNGRSLKQIEEKEGSY